MDPEYEKYRRKHIATIFNKIIMSLIGIIVFFSALSVNIPALILELCLGSAAYFFIDYGINLKKHNFLFWPTLVLLSSLAIILIIVFIYFFKYNKVFYIVVTTTILSLIYFCTRIYNLITSVQRKAPKLFVYLLLPIVIVLAMVIAFKINQSAFFIISISIGILYVIICDVIRAIKMKSDRKY